MANRSANSYARPIDEKWKLAKKILKISSKVYVEHILSRMPSCNSRCKFCDLFTVGLTAVCLKRKDPTKMDNCQLQIAIPNQ